MSGFGKGFVRLSYIMNIGVYIKNHSLENDPAILSLQKSLEAASHSLYRIETRADLLPGTDLVLSIGGDGTFLSASKRVADSGVPILGVNLGRLGFLSENRPEDVVKALLKGEYTIENRSMLNAGIIGENVQKDLGFWPYALNEVTVHRCGGAVLGINVSIDGNALPTYWADGLLVATSSGSTAYSLSAGGPICTPDAKVLIVVPIAPHNLNVRPLVVPEDTDIVISVETRDDKAELSMDNRNLQIDPSWKIHVSLAQFSLKRIRLSGSSFVKALTSKLFWGEDIRNSSE